MTGNALVFIHDNVSCEIVNIVKDERFSEIYRDEIESGLYTFYLRDVHTI